MSTSDNNKDSDIQEFTLTESTKANNLITRMYRRNTLLFVEVFNEYSFFISVQPGKLQDAPKKLREKAKEELKVHGISSEDIALISSQVSGELMNNMFLLYDLEYKIQPENKKKMFTLDDVMNNKGEIDERKLTPNNLRLLHNTRGVLHANKVTKTKFSKNDILFSKPEMLSSLSIDEKYRLYEQMDSYRSKTREQILYEAVVFRAPEVSENGINDDSLTTQIADDSNKDKESNSRNDSLFLEDKDRYITKFVYYDNETNSFKTVPYVIKENRLILPTPTVGTATIPYEFFNIEHLNEFYKREVENKVTIESLFDSYLAIFSHFNKQPKTILVSRAASAIVSYFIDQYATTPYIASMGLPNSGKSTELKTMSWITYRAMMMTNPNAAQAIRLFGNVEPGQHTLFIDEADKLDTDGDIIAMVKDGYFFGGTWQKVNDITRELDFFYTFCMKFWSAEKAPKEWKTMGFYSRTFINMTSIQQLFSNDPNIKNLSLNINLSEQDQSWKNLILKTRKQALLHRLIDYNKVRPNLDINVTGRDRELIYPYIQLFYKTRYQEIIIETMQELLNILNNQRRNSLSAAVCIRLAILLKNGNTNYITLQEIWNSLIEDPDFGTFMRDISGKKKWIDSLDYGEVTQQLIATELKNNIKASIEHKRSGNIWMIDLDSLINRLNSYLVESTRIKVNKVKIGEGCEGCEANFEATQKTLKMSEQSKEVNKDIITEKLIQISSILKDLKIEEPETLKGKSKMESPKVEP